MRELVLERQPKFQRARVVRFEVRRCHLALADPAAVESDGEAEALVDDIDDFPRARVVVVGQLRVVAVTVQCVDRFLDEDAVINCRSSTGRLSHDAGVALFSLSVPSDVAIGEDFMGHALLVCDCLLYTSDAADE